MDNIKPGTICFLVNLTEWVQLTGRVVEVTGIAPDEFFRLDANWIRREFPGGMLAPRKCLMPIAPPEPKATKRTEEPAH